MMKKVFEQDFDPIHIWENDQLVVTVTWQFKTVTQTELNTNRWVNCLKIFEADEFEGLKNPFVFVLGWKGDNYPQ